MRKLAVIVSACAAFAGLADQKYDIAAYVWPAYQPEPRWKELGIFGKGIGEWQNVQEAVPKWEGHHQPLEPLWGYENEADPEVVAKKIDAATAAGVNVFIYDWYWYGKRPFLENALNEGFLKAKNCEKMKFFIMWANHHVNKLWDNRAADKQWGKPIWRSWVDEDEFKVLAKRWIDRYFTRPNYYRIEGKPVLMIYEIGTFIEGVGGLDKAVRSIAYLREACAKAGLGGVHLMACDFGVSAAQVKALGIDSATIYNFVHWSDPGGNPDYADWAAKGARRFDAAKAELGLKAYFAHASAGWDTNPRYPKGKVQATALDSTPEKFEAVLRRAKDWCDANTSAGMPRLITVNSWNEWTEGSYLEPDKRFGYGYLDAVGRVFRSWRPTKAWHGFNLLGLFNAPWKRGDSRTRGFKEEHFRWMKEWGFDFARLPMDYRNFVSTNDWAQLREEGFRELDKAVRWGREYGIHVQPCLHRAPGFTIFPNGDEEPCELRKDARAQKAFSNLWRAMARRYRGIPNEEMSFNLVNEPAGFSDAQFTRVFGDAIRAIRAEDPDRFVMLDGNDVASRPVAAFYSVPSTGQAFRGYTPHAISHYGAWYIKDQPKSEPGWPIEPFLVERKWNFEMPETTFAKYAETRKLGYPVMVGEFGCYNRIKHATCLKWMDHCLGIWTENGVGWALWNLDGAFGILDSGRADVAYEDFHGHKLDRKMLDLLIRWKNRADELK